MSLVMDISSSNETIVIDQKQPSQMGSQIENKDNIILICFDPNNEIQHLNKQIYNVIFYTELQSCITFIQSIQKQQIFLIIPSQHLSPIISSIHQIDSIFIFSKDNHQHTLLSSQNSKLIGIYNDMDLLCSAIVKQIHLIHKNTYKWCFFNQNQYATKDLSKQANDFLWLHLFHYVLLNLSSEPQMKRQKIDLSHHHSPHNVQESEAIQSFMKNSTLQQTINTALTTENTNQLYTFRYFLSDLMQNLSHRHLQIIHHNKENFIVYREMKLSNDELNRFQHSHGQLISMKGFLTANTNRSTALTSSLSSTEETNLVSALFEIQCNVKEVSDEDLVFADITQLIDLSSDQSTILFDFNSTFRLESIQQDEQMWVIKLNAVSDGRTILTKYLYDTHRQIEDLSLSIIFGKFLCDMSQWDQSQIYFQHLLNDSHDEDVAWIEHSIGQTHQWKGEWNEARKYYDHAYDRMMQNEPVRIKDSATILSNIGEILYLQGKYEESLDFHQQALSVRKKYYPFHHSHVATSLENIALIYYRQLKDDKAIDLLNQALTIREEYYDYFHIDIAINLHHIANILTGQREYQQALDYYQRALLIYKQYYSSGHVYIARTLNHLSYILYQQQKHEEALNIAQQALMMAKRFYPSGHIDTANILNNIANIKDQQGNYDECLELYQQVLTIEKKYYSDGHLDIVDTLNSIGDTLLCGKGNCNEALDYHQQAVSMLETHYPLYYAHIAKRRISFGWIRVFPRAIRLRVRPS